MPTRLVVQGVNIAGSLSALHNPGAPHYAGAMFVAGLEIPSFMALAPAARHWLDTDANVRVHGETRERPAREPTGAGSPAHELAP